MKLFVTFLAALAVTEASVNKWTPEGFDWDAQKVTHGVLTQNVSSKPVSNELVVYAANTHNVSSTDLGVSVKVLGIGLAIGWAISNPVSFVVTAAGVASTIQGCVSAIQSPSAAGTFGCIGALASTIGGFGVAKSADKAITGLAGKYWGRNTWDGSGLESIALDVFSKRSTWKRDTEDLGLSEDEHYRQMLHNYMTHRMIRSAGFGEGEFLGYEPDHHPLAKRGDGVHPHVPRFAFNHHKYGRMIVSSRDSNTTAHITVEPFHESRPLRRDDNWGNFEEERLSDHLMEGRFDQEATQADSNDLGTTSAGDVFDTVENGFECFAGDTGMTTWPSGATVDMQMYDNTNRETFGYGSIGIFNDHGTDDQMSGLQPNPPLTGGQDC